jgi:hypothetical protein
VTDPLQQSIGRPKNDWKAEKKHEQRGGGKGRPQTEGCLEDREKGERISYDSPFTNAKGIICVKPFKKPKEKSSPSI